MTEIRHDAPLDERDLALLAELGRLAAVVDPVPDGLADRALFAITLADLQAEMVELVRTELPALAVRAEPVEARTITFTADEAAVMITLSGPPDGDAVRLDGWAAPAARWVVELRTPTGVLREESDDDGRFVVDAPHGPASLVLRRADGTGRPVSTPVIEL